MRLFIVFFTPLYYILIGFFFARLNYLYEYRTILKSRLRYIKMNKVLEKTKLTIVCLFAVGMMIGLFLVLTREEFDYSVITLFIYVIIFVGVAIYFAYDMFNLLSNRRYNVYHTSDSYTINIKRRCEELDLQQIVSFEGFFVERVKIKAANDAEYQSILNKLFDQENLFNIPKDDEYEELILLNTKKLAFYMVGLVISSSLMIISMLLLGRVI